MKPTDLASIERAVAAHVPETLSGDWRFASVALIFRPDPLELLLIKRATHPSDPWSGQIALPGGRRDPGDEDLLATAKRETREEVGLTLGAPLGQLDDLQAVSRAGRLEMGIRPFVFALRSEASFVLDESEVAEAFFVDVNELRSGAKDTTYDLKRDHQTLHLPGYDLGDGKILWGLTYRMLQSLLRLIA